MGHERKLLGLGVPGCVELARGIDVDADDARPLRLDVGNQLGDDLWVERTLTVESVLVVVEFVIDADDRDVRKHLSREGIAMARARGEQKCIEHARVDDGE